MCRAVMNVGNITTANCFKLHQKSDYEGETTDTSRGCCEDYTRMHSSLLSYSPRLQWKFPPNHVTNIRIYSEFEQSTINTRKKVFWAVTVELSSRHLGLTDLITNSSVPDWWRTRQSFHTAHDGTLRISSPQHTQNMFYWMSASALIMTNNMQPMGRNAQPTGRLYMQDDLVYGG